MQIDSYKFLVFGKFALINKEISEEILLHWYYHASLIVSGNFAADFPNIENEILSFVAPYDGGHIGRHLGQPHFAVLYPLSPCASGFRSKSACSLFGRIKESIIILVLSVCIERVSVC